MKPQVYESHKSWLVDIKFAVKTTLASALGVLAISLLLTIDINKGFISTMLFFLNLLSILLIPSIILIVLHRGTAKQVVLTLTACLGYLLGMWLYLLLR